MLIPKRVIISIAKWASYLLFAITLIAAYGGYFNPARFTLPSILLLFFPFLALFSLITAAIWLIAKKWVVGCIGIATLLACGPTFPEALPLKWSNSPSDPSRTFKIVTFNSLHMEDIKKKNKKTGRPIDYLLHCDADFICLQEFYFFTRANYDKKTNRQIDSLFNLYPYHTDYGNREVQFFSKYPFKVVDPPLSDGKNYRQNFTTYRVQIDGRELSIVNLHLTSFRLSNSDRNIITELSQKSGAKKSINEFKGSVYRKMKIAFKNRAELSRRIAEAVGKLPDPVIICGDFNDVPGSWTYRNFTKEGFFDAYASTGFGHLITYNQHLMLFHIDQILYRGALVPLWVKKGKLNSSDHYPLEAEFEFI